MIFFFTDYPLYSAVDHHLGADKARLHSAINSRALQTNAKTRCLADCILLGVNSPDAVLAHCAVRAKHVSKHMAFLVAMRYSNRRTYITCGEYPPILNYYAAAPSPVAGSPLSHLPRNP